MYLNANIFSVESLSSIRNGLLKMGYRCLFLFLFLYFLKQILFVSTFLFSVSPGPVPKCLGPPREELWAWCQ